MNKKKHCIICNRVFEHENAEVKICCLCRQPERNKEMIVINKARNSSLFMKKESGI